MRKFSILFAGMTIIAAMLACNMPSSQGIDAASTALALTQTSVAQTVQAAVQTSSLPSATSTFTPVPFPTLPPATLPAPASATSTCDIASFITDVTYPDNTTVNAGDGFTKTWRLKNVGTCSWTPSYAVVFMSGELMGGPSVQALTGNVNPGQTVDISVGLTAPTANGTHIGYWGIRNAAGVIFLKFYIQIIVGSASGTTGPFAVTSIGYSVTGSCGGFHITAHITTNGAGTVKYYWEFNGNDPDEGTYGSTLDFSSAGTKDTPVLDWSISASGDHFAQVYIESPNHQFIGQANVHCP